MFKYLAPIKRLWHLDEQYSIAYIDIETGEYLEICIFDIDSDYTIAMFYKKPIDNAKLGIEKHKISKYYE